VFIGEAFAGRLRHISDGEAPRSGTLRTEPSPWWSVPLRGDVQSLPPGFLAIGVPCKHRRLGLLCVVSTLRRCTPIDPLLYTRGMTITPTPAQKPLALAYIRVSTTEQVENGASLDAQRTTLVAEAEKRGWDVEVVADEGLSAKSLKRPGLLSALARLDAGKANYLMAIRLDRVSRSVSDFAGLLDRAANKGWDLTLLSPNIDTSDPAGRFTANVLASAAQYERELIGVRTREGMAQRRLEGVRLGRPRTMSTAVVERIQAGRRAGLSLRAIADALNADQVPTAQGGSRWYASTVKAVLDSDDDGGSLRG